MNRWLDSFVENHYAVQEDFLTDKESRALLCELHEKDHAGQMRPAGVGRGETFRRLESIRTDRIHWLEPDTVGSAGIGLLTKLDALKQCLNRELFLGLVDCEAHFALYESGGFYAKHLDRFADESRRLVSCVLYLNRDWAPEDGGQLRIFERSGAVQEISPQAGRLVLFRSDSIWHEVLPSRRARCSVAGWFRRRELTGLQT